LILDGFPRHLQQLEAVKSLLDNSVWKVLYLDAPEKLAAKRIASRIVCATCGFVSSKSEKDPKKCNACGNCEWLKRKEDSQEALMDRLHLFRKQTLPLLESLQKDQLIKLNATETTKQLVAQISMLYSKITDSLSI
jgi:adenylate kinase